MLQLSSPLPTPWHTRTRARGAEEDDDAATVRFRSYGLARKREGVAWRKRRPIDCDPTAETCAPARPSRVQLVGWAESLGSSPRNSADQKRILKIAETEELFEIAKQLQKL